MRWLRGALILAACALAASCTPTSDGPGPIIVNPQVDPPSANGSGGRVVTPGSGGSLVMGSGGSAPAGTGGSVSMGPGGLAAAGGAPGAGGNAGGAAGAAGSSGNGGFAPVDASVPDSGPPPTDGGADSGDAAPGDGARL